jgi:DNA topoisomerase-1
MAQELIITEKPASAKKIAEALADTKPILEKVNGIPTYKLTHKGKDITVGCAVGHVFGLGEREKAGWTYPVFDIEWKPSYEISKANAHTKKYITALKRIGKGVKKFIVATDFDIEGEVIGLNIIRHLYKQKDARRMKFSTLTEQELVNSYEHSLPTLEWGQALAGETRHELDWYYGINLSRALTLAVKAAKGGFKLLSSGRVQGPALKIVIEREKIIQAFKPEPFWQIQLVGEAKDKVIEAWHKQDKFWEKEQADKVMENVKDKEAVVASVEAKKFNQAPPTPFDLTTLQIEAYRTCRISPKDTLAIAQSLYTSAYISYPRTSSQKLPKSIGYDKIIKSLSNQEDYAKLCSDLLKKKLEPNEGKKTDDAHPAIHPTGEVPAKLNAREAKIYDLIVRRFLSCFADSAVRETVTIDIDVNKEIFVAKGTRTIEKGWHVYYGPFVRLAEEELPDVKQGDRIDVKDITLHDKETQPPKRYTPASLIKELEKRNLGTKATRSVIIENLYNRGYIKDESIAATPLGIQTEEILEKYIPEIVDEDLTKSFEEDMEHIRKGEKKEEEILDHAKEVLIKILDKFKQKEKEIGDELAEANKSTMTMQTFIGKCPNCKEGELHIRKGKFGRFLACNKYPDCKTTFSLPDKGVIKPMPDQQCSECSHPVVYMKQPRQKAMIVCINPKCPTWKRDYKKKEED